MVDLLGSRTSDVRALQAPLLYPLYLQEAADWKQELASWNSRDHVSGGLVALCRQWSDRLAGKAPVALAGTRAADALVALQDWLASLDYPPQWQWVSGVDGVPPDPLPIELARTMLDAYLSGWIQPVPCELAAWDAADLYRRLLGVSVAFDIVAFAAPEDARPQVLATTGPRQVPSFNGLDLWLQRRALRACTTRLGVGFVRDHLDALRDETVVSLALGTLLSAEELIEVHSLLQCRASHSSGPEPDELLGAFHRKIHRHAVSP